MEKVTLSAELLNGILQYLGTRPYMDVAQLIAGIQKEASEQAAEAPQAAE